MKALKVYECNYDGRVTRGVFTDTKKRALELIEVTASTYRTYGMTRDWETDSDAGLRAAPHTPLEKRISAPSKRWFQLDTFRQYALYENASKRAGTHALPFEEWFSPRDTKGDQP